MVGLDMTGFEMTLYAGIGMGLVLAFQLFKQFVSRNHHSNPGYGERIAALEAIIGELRKNVKAGFERLERQIDKLGKD